MTRNINEFPQELLRLVLSQVRADAQCSRDGRFVNALATCSLWHQIGEEIIWIDMSLTNTQMSKFCALTSPAPSPWLDLVRSMSLKIFASDYGSSHIDDVLGYQVRGPQDRALQYPILLRGDFERLSGILKFMPHLESFSLSVVPMNERAVFHKLEIEQEELKLILDSLPASVVHLEIDTAGYEVDYQYPRPEVHLCLSVKELIPRLQNCRLRILNICEEIIPGPSADRNPEVVSAPLKTNTLILQTAGRGPLQDTEHCNGMQSRDATLRGLPNAHVLDHLTPLFSAALKNNAFGNFQRCSLFDVHCSQEKPFDRRVEFSTICERVLMPDEKVRKYPLYQPGGDMTTPFGLRYMTPSGKQLDLLATPEDTLKLAEGEAWIETAARCRLPKVYFEQTPRFRDTWRKGITKFEIEDILAETDWKHNLWWLERLEGQAILRAEEVQGLNGAGCVKRDLTRREIRRQEAREAKERGEEFMIDDTDSDVSDSENESRGGDEDDEDFLPDASDDAASDSEDYESEE